VTDPTPNLLGETFPVIETPHFRLRKVEDSDLDDIFTVFSDPEALRYWSHVAMKEKEEAAAYIRRISEGWTTRHLLQWAVTRIGEDRLIGTCTWYEWSQSNRRAGVGYILARRHWGQGIMREVLPAFVRFGFVTMDLNRIEADVDPRNLASLRTLERLGFQRDGYLRERYQIGGETQDAVLLGLLRSEAGALLR